MSYDQIKALRTASAEQLQTLLQDPQQRRRLEPLLKTLQAASFQLSAQSQIPGQHSEAALSGQNLQLDGSGTLQLEQLRADIRNGALHFQGTLGRSSTQADYTRLGDLQIVASAPAGQVRLESPALTIQGEGQASGTLRAGGELRSQGSDSRLAARGQLQFRLEQGAVTASRLEDGRLEAEVDVRTLKEMVRSDARAQAVLEAFAQHGITPVPGQKVRVVLREADLRSSQAGGHFSGTLELPQLQTSFGPMRLQLQVQAKSSQGQSQQDIWGHLSFRPQAQDLAELLNRQVRAGLALNHTGSAVQVGRDQAQLDFRHLLGQARIQVAADGQSLRLNVDQARLLSLFDMRDAAAAKIRRALAEQGIQIRQQQGQLVIPVAALNTLLQGQLPAGLRIESLNFDQGRLSGAFRYRS